MEHFTAVVEVSKRGNMSGDEVDAAMDRLAGYPVSLSVSPRGYRTARITLPADTIGQAATAALVTVTHGFGVAVDQAVSLEVMTEAEAELREGSAVVPELIGVTEAAELLGVSPQAVRQMIDRGRIAAHRIGERSFALVRSEVLAAAERKQGGLPSLETILNAKGWSMDDVVLDPLVEDRVEYRWVTPAGEVFESEALTAPPDATTVHKRIVRRYLFRIPGRIGGGFIESLNGVETSLFDIRREGDWTPVD